MLLNVVIVLRLRMINILFISGIIIMMIHHHMLLILIMIINCVVHFLHTQITRRSLRQHLQRYIPSIIILQLQMEGCNFPLIEPLHQ